MARQSITNNDNGVSLLEKVLHNINELKTTLGVIIPSTAVPGSDDNGPVLIGKLNTVFSLLARGTSYTPLTGNENGPAFVTALNTVFTALYTAASGDPSVTTIYDLTCAKKRYYPCNIQAGETFIIKYDSTKSSGEMPGSNVNITVSSYAENGGNKDLQEVLLYSTTAKGIISKSSSSSGGLATGWGVPFTATKAASLVRIQNSENISIEHNEAISENISPWNGKKWLLIGDSTSTESERWDNRYSKLPYQTGRGYADEGYANVGYGMIVAQALGLRRYNIARSGWTTKSFLGGTDYAAGMASSQKTDITTYRDDIDVVTILLGTNDNAYYGTTQASINAYVERCGALYSRAKSKWPAATVIFISPMERWGTAQSTYNKLEDMVEALAAWCSSNNIPFIDIYHDGTLSTGEAYTAIDPVAGGEGLTPAEYRTKYFFPANATCPGDGTTDGDGTHPNDLGHATFMAPRILDWFNSHTPNE